MKLKQKLIAVFTLTFFLIIVILSFVGHLTKTPSDISFNTTSLESGEPQPKYQFYDILTERQQSLSLNNQVYWVQIGAFSQESEAEKLADKANKAGFSATLSQDGSNYTVRVGNEASLESAEALEKELQEKQFNTLIKHRQKLTTE